MLNFLGIVAKFRGDYDEAERLFRLGREMNVRIRNRRGEAIAIGALGTVAFDFRLDYDDAVQRFHEAATIFRELGDDLNALVMQGNLAESLCAELERLGLPPLPSAAPFFLMRVGDGAAFRRVLLPFRILVRDCASFGSPAYVRLAPRTAEIKIGCYP